ncbi:hypothetical protein E4U16_005153 [Claviceps sp. LM84 group G4]|nr:hypothetical protein E4U16_005153 [Claviceps sp. LM84 group G4]
MASSFKLPVILAPGSLDVNEGRDADLNTFIKAMNMALEGQAATRLVIATSSAQETGDLGVVRNERLIIALTQLEVGAGKGRFVDKVGMITLINERALKMKFGKVLWRGTTTASARHDSSEAKSQKIAVNGRMLSMEECCQWKNAVNGAMHSGVLM